HHRFTGSATWQVPFAHNTRGAFRQILDGWEVNVLFVARSGAPFSLYDCTSGVAICPRAIPDQTGFSNHTSGTRQDPSGTPDQFVLIDLTKFTFTPWVNPKTGNGDVGPFPSNMLKRNTFRGPGAWNTDLGVYKSFRISEGKSLQFRGEMYNLFNHANMFYDGTQLDVSTPQLSPPSGSGFFVPGFRTGHRNVQMALKFIF